MKDKLIKTLEIEKNGDWNKAHEIVQNYTISGRIGFMLIYTAKNQTGAMLRIGTRGQKNQYLIVVMKKSGTKFMSLLKVQKCN